MDVIRKLEQGRKQSARLPTLHAIAQGLGVELTKLLGDPPAVASKDADPPALTELRRAITPSLMPKSPGDLDGLDIATVRAEVADGWTLYHSAAFPQLLDTLPSIVEDARLLANVGSSAQRESGAAALGKSLQLAGHLALRLGKEDLELSALERAAQAADDSGDVLLTPMVHNSIAWAYQRQNRLDDAEELAVASADSLERDHPDDAARVRVWGGLVMSASTSAARHGDYDHAAEMMSTAEQSARRLAALPFRPGMPKMSSRPQA